MAQSTSFAELSKGLRCFAKVTQELSAGSDLCGERDWAYWIGVIRSSLWRRYWEYSELLL